MRFDGYRSSALTGCFIELFRCSTLRRGGDAIAILRGSKLSKRMGDAKWVTPTKAPLVVSVERLFRDTALGNPQR